MPKTVTRTLCERYRKNPPATRLDVRDDRDRGFYIRVSPTGSITFRVDLKRDGRWEKHTIGPYDPNDPASVENARMAAKRRMVEAPPVHPEESGNVGGPAPATPLTLGDFLRDTYGPWLEANLKDGTEEWQRLEAALGPPPETPHPGRPVRTHTPVTPKALDAITREDIDRIWRTERKADGASGSTINRDLNAINAMFNRAVDWGYLKYNPINHLRREKVDKKGTGRPLEGDEAQRLVSALMARDRRMAATRRNANLWRQTRDLKPLPERGKFADHLTPVVTTALHTGMRIGEVLSLQWSDVDFKKEKITVRGEETKAGQTREVPMSNHLMDVLHMWQYCTGQRQGWVFPSPKKPGTHITTIKKSWQKLLQDAKIEEFRIHDMRHNFISITGQVVGNVESIRDVVGHASPEMLRRYQKVFETEKRKTVEVMDSQPKVSTEISFDELE